MKIHGINEIVFNCYELGTLKCSSNQPNFENYKINSLNSLTIGSLRPFRRLTIEKILVADRLMDGIVQFSISLNIQPMP
jgi:hypothetical protein